MEVERLARLILALGKRIGPKRLAAPLSTCLSKITFKAMSVIRPVYLCTGGLSACGRPGFEYWPAGVPDQ